MNLCIIRRAAHLGTKAGAARESELNPALPIPPPVVVVASTSLDAAAGVKTGVVEPDGGRNILLPGLKTGAAEVEERENAVGVAPDSELWAGSARKFVKSMEYDLLGRLLIFLGVLILLIDAMRVYAALVLEPARPVNQYIPAQPLRRIYAAYQLHFRFCTNAEDVPFFSPADVAFCGESPVLPGVGALIVTACPNLGAAAAATAAAGTKAGGSPCAGPLRGLSWAMVADEEGERTERRDRTGSWDKGKGMKIL